jgi:hypothetical protein
LKWRKSTASFLEAKNSVNSVLHLFKMLELYGARWHMSSAQEYKAEAELEL